MSSRQPGDRHRRQRSPSPADDRNSDFQYALKLSVELNGDPGGHAEASAAAAKRPAEYETDFDFAELVQSNDETGSKTNVQAPSYLPSTRDFSLPAFHEAYNSAEATSVDTDDPGLQPFITLLQFQDYLKASKCATCGTHFLESKSDVTVLFDDWYSGKDALSSALECKQCGATSCIACPGAGFSGQPLSISENKSTSWCCTTGRLVLIWVLLCGFDSFYCTTKADNARETSVAKTKPEPPPTEPVKGKSKAKGKGKAEVSQSAQYSGIGYGGSDSYTDYGSSNSQDEWEDDIDAFSDSSLSHVASKTNKTSQFSAKGSGRTISDDKSEAFEIQQPLDQLATKVFSLLDSLLPSFDRGRAFDLNPPAIIAEMLLESRILSYCADLLRNESLDDALSRKRTYEAVLDFLKTLGMHSATAQSTVFSRRLQQPELCNLLTQTYNHVKLPSQNTVPSIADDLRGMSRLSDLLLKNAEHYKAFYEAGADQELLSLCRKISELWRLLCLSLPSSTSNEGGFKSSEQTSAGKVANIIDVADDQICTLHAFTTKAKAQSRSGLGRFRRLVSEINMLKTSLPPNIFVRHGESRLDMMKCVIVGPEGTPYENGLFEFDIYCPSEYPNCPPAVSFKGTGGGVHGINPNLYADGKVCLSLLGTWSGEPWRPGESTLLQVLVSLQAMVFCEQPWYNEPGRESSYGSARTKGASDAYNRRLRELTVRLGMIAWLEKTPSIWKDVVAQHFKSKADKILANVIEWSRLSKPLVRAQLPVLPDHGEEHYDRSETGYGKILPKLHEQLKEYGATVALPVFPREETGPQYKRPRVEGSQVKGPQIFTAPPVPEPVPSYFDHHKPDHVFDEMYSSNAFGDTTGFNNIMAPIGALHGGYRGRGVTHPGYSFRGRGHVVSTGPSNTPPALPATPAPAAPAAPASGSEGGRGRGSGRGSYPWLGRGGPIPGSFSPYSFPHEYGKVETLGGSGGGDKATRGGRGSGGSPFGWGYDGRGGRGGRGDGNGNGCGSSSAGA